jgi:hypothetical protein
MSDLENTGSAFYTHQCGDYDAFTNPGGFIGGANLLHDVIGHEIGSFQSHYKNYSSFQNDPAHNVGVAIEAAVGAPPKTFDQYNQELGNTITAKQQAIRDAFSAEP